MNGHDPDTTDCVPGADHDRPSRLGGLVGTMIGHRVGDLHIEVRGGGLVLRGRASSYHAKQLAQHAALAVTDLPLIANEIEVIGLARAAHGPEDAADPENNTTRARVLLATRDDRLRSVVRSQLIDQGHVIATAAGGVECVTLLREFAPDVLVLDTALLWGGADGVLARLRERDGVRVPVVLLCARSSTAPGITRPTAPPVVAVIETPVAMETLVRAVRAAANGETAADPGA
jgi:CheY-like chemotaxis protein